MREFMSVFARSASAFFSSFDALTGPMFSTMFLSSSATPFFSMCDRTPCGLRIASTVCFLYVASADFASHLCTAFTSAAAAPSSEPTNTIPPPAANMSLRGREQWSKWPLAADTTGRRSQREMRATSTSETVLRRSMMHTAIPVRVASPSRSLYRYRNSSSSAATPMPMPASLSEERKLGRKRKSSSSTTHVTSPSTLAVAAWVMLRPILARVLRRFMVLNSYCSSLAPLASSASSLSSFARIARTRSTFRHIPDQELCLGGCVHTAMHSPHCTTSP
mmetsp:Transcript_40162/g.95322  ORF Transcript_40162/g.95322 Transcript_40162/m.95322 type:complete len:277 (-) Transcript_40162:1199-2029(-)